MTAAFVPEPSTTDDDAQRPSLLQRYGLRALIGVVGVVLAAGVVLTDDKDPVVFALPLLVATTVVIGVLTIAGRSSEARAFERAARDTGLTYDGVRPVPPVTPLLAGVRAPAHMISGDLDPYGPEVRVAKLRDRLVAIVDLSEEGDVRGIDAGTREWLDDHALPADAAIEDELLVVAVDRDTPPRRLLELTRAIVARL